MQENRFTFISGRTLRQGRALHRGKHSAEYREEVSCLEVSRQDIEALSLKEGQEVRLRSQSGEVKVRLRISDGLPRGIVFMAYGPPANRLTGADTGGTGMPDSKGIEVQLCG